MTKDNPFTARIKAAAKEGYVTGYRGYTRRTPAPVAPVVPFENTPVPETATAKQVELIVNLIGERDLSVESRPKYAARLAELNTDHAAIGTLTKVQASALITYLFGLPNLEVATDVPEGHYAVERAGAITFYEVDRPVEGKYAGGVFVKLLHGPDETRITRQAAASILALIAVQGVKDCAIRYGKEIGRCGVCHRRLTNEASRAAGIGPKCAAHMGW